MSFDIIFITGASGFVGSMVFGSLRGQSNLYTIDRHLVVHKPDADSASLPLDYFLTEKFSNVRKKTCLLVHCATHYVRRGEAFDFGAVIRANVSFGSEVVQKLDEKTDLAVLNFNSAFQKTDISGFCGSVYSASKEFFRMYLKDSGVRTYNVFLYDTFGLGDTRDKIMVKLKEAVSRGSQVEVKSPDLSLALTSIDDVVLGVRYCINNFGDLEKKSDFGFLHSNSLISIREIVDELSENDRRSIVLTDSGSRPTVFKLGELPEGFSVQGDLIDKIIEYLYA